MRIPVEQALGVIVDIQDRLFPHIDRKEELENRVQVLIKGLHVLEIPVVLTEQYTKGLGPTISSISEVLQAVEPIEKLCFSCCDEPRFQSALKEIGRSTVILAGIETHVCILQTSIDLIEAGYTPVVPADAVSSRKSSDKEIALLRIAAEGGIITTTESLLLELCRFAGTPVFKEISRMIK